MAAHQAPPSLGFFRQEHCSGLPLPSPMHESEKWKWSRSVVPQIRSVAQSCPTLCDPMNRSTPGLPVQHQLPEFTETHVHWDGDAIQPSHPLSSPSPPAPSPSQHQSLLPSKNWLFEGLPWESSALDFTFHCRECKFSPWSGSKCPTCLAAKEAKKAEAIF